MMADTRRDSTHSNALRCRGIKESDEFSSKFGLFTFLLLFSAIDVQKERKKIQHDEKKN